MTRQVAVRRGSFRRNCLAAIISTAVLFGLSLVFHASPAGAGHDVRHTLAQISAPSLQLTVVAPSPEGPKASKGEAIDPAQLQKQVHAAVHSSRVALELYVALLEIGKSRLEKTPDYTAAFFKQERHDGNEDELSEMQVMEVKVRHAPFSVFMNWTEGDKEGQEVLYVDGLENNRMVVKLGGIGRLTPALKLEPSGNLAMKEARHPITDMGLLNLTRKIITYRKRDLERGKGVQWQLIPDQKCFDRDCVCLLIQYESKEYDQLYRKTLTYIDKELSLPICIKNFTWPADDMKEVGEKLDEKTCIEYYGYKDVKLNAGLKEVDFDQANEDYHFVRR